MDNEQFPLLCGVRFVTVRDEGEDVCGDVLARPAYSGNSKHLISEQPSVRKTARLLECFKGRHSCSENVGRCCFVWQMPPKKAWQGELGLR